MAVALGAIDLMTIRSTRLIGQIAELQEAGRTGRLRLNWAAHRVRNSLAPNVRDFADPLGRARRLSPLDEPSDPRRNGQDLGSFGC